MYTRELLEKRHTPLEKGKPVQGTWTEPFDEVDLLDVSPYSVPLPLPIKDLRIKEWQSFTIQNQQFFFHAWLSNLKYYHSAFVLLHNKETGDHVECKKVVLGRGWSLPRSLRNASVDSRSQGFFFRIHSWLDAKRITLDINIRQRRKLFFTAHATFDFAQFNTTPMAVNLLFSEYRNMYAYKAFSAVRGNVVSGDLNAYFDHNTALGVFCDVKGYFPYRMRSTWCTATGFDSEDRRFGFAVGENQTRESFNNNENALWVDGHLTPLPPVTIMQVPNTGDWTIQDMEGMVDLVFTPKKTGRFLRNYLVSSGEYEYPVGVFNGNLVDINGKKIEVRDLWGMGEKLYLRM